MLEKRVLEALEEIGNVGSAHAVTALSQLLEKTCMISTPTVHVVERSALAGLAGPGDALVAGVNFHVVGDASARVLLILPRPCALELVDVLLRQAPGSTKTLNELGNSTIRETGNIMASAYLNGLSDFLAMLLLPSVPNLVFDISGAVMDLSVEGLETLDGKIVGVSTEVRAEGTGVKGHLFMFVDSSSLEVMAQSAELVSK